MPFSCLPIDIFCQFASFLEMIWILVTLAWVTGAGILSYSILNRLRFMISKKITVEWIIIPTLFIMYWVYTMVALLTLASIGLVIALAVFGIISVPTSFMLFNFLKVDLKKKQEESEYK